MKRKHVFTVLFIAILLAFSAGAWAQGFSDAVASAQSQLNMAEVLNPAGSDRTMRWLNVLFGPLLDDGASSPLPAVLQTMFQTFNLLILAVSTLFLTYNFSVGILQTANDGEFLGQRWSGLWAPVRVGAAFVMLFPLGSGYTVMQHGSIKVAVLGIGVANQLWKGIGDMVTNGHPIVSFEIPDASIYARDIFYSELCSAYLNSHESEVRQRAFIAVQAKLKSNPATKNYAIQYDGEPETSYPASICGKFTIATSEIQNRLQALKEPDGIFGTSLFRSDPAPEVTDFMLRAQIEASMRLRDAMAQLAFNMVDARLQKLQSKAAELTYGNPSTQLATQALRQYTVDMQNAATAAQQLMRGKDMQKQKNDMLVNGWSDAGVWWWTINKMNQSVTEAASAIPATTTRVNPTTVAKLTEVWNFAELYSHASLWWSQVSYQPDQRVNASWMIDMVDPTRTLTGKPSYSAFSGLMSLGNSMLYGATAIFATGIALDVVGFASDLIPAKWGLSLASKGASKVFSVSDKFGGPSLGRFTDLVSGYVGNAFGFLGGLVGPLFIFGIVLAIVLPLYPFFGFVAATISWLILVMEAVLAAPLWAFAHLRMDGHEFATDASKAGYRISLNILMRPSLLLFGLIMSYIVFELFAGFMSERFMQTIYNINGGETTITNILYMIVFVAVIVIGASKSFALITELPDRVMRWVGVDREARDEREFTEGTRSAAHGGLAAVGGASLSTGASALKNSVGRVKQIGRVSGVM